MSILEGDILIEEAHSKLSKLEEKAKEHDMTLEEYIEHLKRIKIITQAASKTIGPDLVPVVPMNGPYGQVFYCDTEW